MTHTSIAGGSHLDAAYKASARAAAGFEPAEKGKGKAAEKKG